MNTQQLPRREREKQRQRQDIMAAAFSLFSEKGYHNVSVQEIAERAEFAVGTLYKFFKSKGELYKESTFEHIGELTATLHDELDGAQDEIEALRRFVRVKGDHYRENATRIRIYIDVVRCPSDPAVAEMEAQMTHWRHVMLDRISAIFESGMKTGKFQRIGEPYHLAISLDGIVHAFLNLWLEKPERHPFPTDPDIILNMLFKGLIND